MIKTYYKNPYAETSPTDPLTALNIVKTLQRNEFSQWLGQMQLHHSNSMFAQFKALAGLISIFFRFFFLCCFQPGQPLVYLQLNPNTIIRMRKKM